LIDPFLTEKHDQSRKPINSIVMSGLLRETLSTREDLSEEQRTKFEELKTKVDTDILDIFKRPINVEVEKEDNEGSEIEEASDETKKVKIKIQSNEDIKRYMEDSAKSMYHITLLYKNSFISLLSSVEWFLSQILHYYYDKHPDAAGVQKKTLTLADLKGFNSIHDAEKYLVDLKIEEILRNSFDNWINLLKTELSLKLGYLTDALRDELIEIYQRRNLLVHNGGIVNSIYLAKVSEDYRKGIKLNDTLDVDKTYLDNAILKLQKSFILIAAELWKNLDKDDKSRGDVLITIVYDNLLQSRWDICEGLSYFILHDAKLDPIDKVVSQLNFWLCKKRTNQFSGVKKEIDAADYSDKKEIFQLGLFALRDDKDSFFNMLPSALDSKQLNIERLEEFPIFKEMRETEEYARFKVETKYFKEPNQPVLKLTD
jgi:hypothetical protein